MGVRIIGLGQPVAGDDGVGIAIVRRLREQGVPPGAELCEVPEPTALIPLLATHAPVVLVDAAVGGRRPGEVLVLTPDAFAGGRAVPLSTHGLGVLQAVELARTLTPEAVSRRIQIVAVTIVRPARHGDGLSPEVAAAVPRAVAAVRALAEG
jgi:hydrogenase maturation protease